MPLQAFTGFARIVPFFHSGVAVINAEYILDLRPLVFLTMSPSATGFPDIAIPYAQHPVDLYIALWRL